MPGDAKLYFSTDQLFAGAAAVSEYYLDVKQIAEMGRGSPLYVNIVVKTVNATYTAHGALSVYLCTHTGAPVSAHRIAAISVNDMTATTGGDLLSTGLKVKAALPSLNLLDHVGLWYSMGTGCSGCKLDSFLTLG
jgi:hypothetical protein